MKDLGYRTASGGFKTGLEATSGVRTLAWSSQSAKKAKALDQIHSGSNHQNTCTDDFLFTRSCSRNPIEHKCHSHQNNAEPEELLAGIRVTKRPSPLLWRIVTLLTHSRNPFREVVLKEFPNISTHIRLGQSPACLHQVGVFLSQHPGNDAP